MRSDYSQRGKSGKRSGQRLRGRWVLLIVLLLCLLGVLGYYIFQQKKHPEQFPMATAFFTSVKSWFSEHKQQLHQNIESVKQMTKNQETPPEQIHFDFYTALPAMQMPASMAAKENEPAAVKPAKERALFDPAELEEDFSKQMMQSRKNTSATKKLNRGNIND